LSYSHHPSGQGNDGFSHCQWSRMGSAARFDNVHLNAFFPRFAGDQA